MNDREMLTLAAKAAGIDLESADWGGGLDGFYWVEGARMPQTVRYWNPLTDDGDEARLEAVLGMDVVWDREWVYVWGQREAYYDHNNDRQAARRRAGVRAAAEIGKAMP